MNKKMDWINFFVIIIYLIQVQPILAARLTGVPSEIEDVQQTNSLFNCSQYANDYEIIDAFSFLVELDPAIEYSTMTYASMDKDGNIYYMKIAHQECVPSIIYCLKHLSELYVENTSFCDSKQRLPTEIEYFAPSLIRLRISDTTIFHLPEQIGKLTRLQSLNLSNTGLMSLTDAIRSLSSLTLLSLPNNNLTYLPTAILNLRLLSQINLKNNPYLRSIHQLNGLPSLKMLYTSHCPIENLPRNLPQLTNLYMRNNTLKRLTGIETLGNETSNKKHFDFAMNQIPTVPPSIRYVNNLYRLNLNDNLLNNLPMDIFEIMTLSHLHIRHNNFSRPLLDEIKSKFHDKNPNLTLHFITRRQSAVKSS